jgi:hypothetical protein
MLLASQNSRHFPAGVYPMREVLQLPAFIALMVSDEPRSRLKSLLDVPLHGHWFALSFLRRQVFSAPIFNGRLF